MKTIFDLEVEQMYSFAPSDTPHTAIYGIPGNDMQDAYDLTKRWVDGLFFREIFNIHLIDPATQARYHIVKDGAWVPLGPESLETRVSAQTG